MSAPSATALQRAPRWIETARALYELTRPRVLLLVVITVPSVFFVGRPETRGPLQVVAIAAGVWLLGAACSAFNAWIERVSDGFMERTKSRPLPSGRLAPPAALWFGGVTALLSLVLLYVQGTWLSAVVGAVTLGWYVLLYTAVLKRRTPQNIVIGGAAGAAGPLIADAAVTGTLRPVSIVLFLVIFLWTPAHFWAIALLRKAEYAAAGIPMMPSCKGDQPTRWRMLGWNLVLVPVSLVPVFRGELGWIYGAVAAVAGALFVSLTIAAIRKRSRRADGAVFGGSLVYLLAIFVAVAIDALAA